MCIDDPQDALDTQLAAEERAKSPLMRFIPDLQQVLELLPTETLPSGLGEPAMTAKLFSKLAGIVISRARNTRRDALTDVISSEIRWLKKRLAEISDDHRRFMREQFPGLVLDALEKAEQTRSLERIVRMGRIVANAAVAGPARPPDTTEELCRLAMFLDDSDVLVLAELVRGQRRGFNEGLGSVPGELVNNYWRSGEGATHDVGPSVRPQKPGRLSAVAGRLDIPEGELQTRCAKLQAYGLIVQVERNNSKVPPGVVPYAILTRGIEFIDSIESLAR